VQTEKGKMLKRASAVWRWGGISLVTLDIDRWSLISFDVTHDIAPWWKQWQPGTHTQSSNPRCIAVNLNLNLSPNLWLFNPKTVPLVGYPKVIPYTKFEHFGVIRFWVIDIFIHHKMIVKMKMESKNKQTDRQTNKQTNRQTRTSYPRRPKLLAWVITERFLSYIPVPIALSRVP